MTRNSRLHSLALASLSVLVGMIWLPGMARAQFGGGQVQPTAKKKSAYDSLIRVVTTTVAPESWDSVGGPGAIEAIDAWGLMIVSQTPEAHEQIGHLLRVVRDGIGKQGRPAGTAQPPQDATSLSVESPANAAARKTIAAALDRPTELSFNDSPLRTVIASIRKTHGINVVIDRKALEELGIGDDTPVSIELKKVSLRSALRLILGEIDLTYTVRNEVLTITTPEETESQLITRVYLVKDLADK